MKAFRIIACLCAVAAAAGGARAEAPQKLALVWSVPVEPDEGFALGFGGRLALHADGTVLLAIEQEREERGDSFRSVLVLSAAPDGRINLRSAPQPQSRHYIRGVAVAPEADGFALLTNREPEHLVVYRLARDGRVRATHPLRFRGEKMQELEGIAADGRGNVIVHGGAFEGPHSPALALVDKSGRVVWKFAGKDPMPPGGVRTVRFRRDGGNDAVVIDREKPFWERRSAAGALVARTALSMGTGCWGFLDERRLVHVFFNYEEQAAVKAPAKSWVLGMHGPHGRLLEGHRVVDLPADDNAYCKFALSEAGWIAAALSPPKIGLFDGTLMPRGELDASAQGITSIDALAVDRDGAVTALVDTRPVNRPGRKMLVLRFAPPAR